jgi:hypothetical protein
VAVFAGDARLAEARDALGHQGIVRHQKSGAEAVLLQEAHALGVPNLATGVKDNTDPLHNGQISLSLLPQLYTACNRLSMRPVSFATKNHKIVLKWGRKINKMCCAPMDIVLK